MHSIDCAQLIRQQLTFNHILRSICASHADESLPAECAFEVQVSTVDCSLTVLWSQDMRTLSGVQSFLW